ncbi:MAG: hypothetical protein IJH64_15465, partial [Oscillospiraceae bacterium]|nr:hypothetical protein [Oscillospiraceae bacterium]
MPDLFNCMEPSLETITTHLETSSSTELPQQKSVINWDDIINELLTESTEFTSPQVIRTCAQRSLAKAMVLASLLTHTSGMLLPDSQDLPNLDSSSADSMTTTTSQRTESISD